MKIRENRFGNDNIQKELNMKIFAEGNEDMKNKKSFTGWIGKGLTALMLSCGLLLAAVPAWSAVDCEALADPNGDFDSDGIRNGEECAGIPLVDGTPVPSCPGVSPRCCPDPLPRTSPTRAGAYRAGVSGSAPYECRTGASRQVPAGGHGAGDIPGRSICPPPSMDNRAPAGRAPGGASAGD